MRLTRLNHQAESVLNQITSTLANLEGRVPTVDDLYRSPAF